MGTKNHPGEFDCYAKAEPDEPMFILLARDKHAPTLVWLWATLRELDNEDPAKVQEARDCVMAMINWAHARGRKVCGLGQATLAGNFDLIRAANFAGKQDSKNTPTTIDLLRRFLAATTFEGTDGKTITPGA